MRKRNDRDTLETVAINSNYGHNMAAAAQISVEVLQLGTVQLPDFHPRAADGTCVIQGFLVRHPDGLILFDTGCGTGHPLIDELYQPDVILVADALHRVGADERDVASIVNSHLHFDHCGQNGRFPGVPVWVQQPELVAAEQPHFTVPEWAAIASSQRRVIDGDEEIAPGVTILSTPGHTPGHQSLLVESNGHRELIAGQACYSCHEFEDGTISASDMHDDSWLVTGQESLKRLQALNADVVRFSHDRLAFHPSIS